MTNTNITVTPRSRAGQSDYARYFNTLHELLLNVAVTNGQGQHLSIEEGTQEAIAMLAAAGAAGGKIMLVGNGGSAAIASHQAVDFTNAVGIPAISFSDAAQLTCFGNDYGYDQVYVRSIEMFAQAGDVLIAISSSGKSQNILNAAAAAKQKGCVVITLAGFSSGAPLLGQGVLNFYVDSDRYGPVEVAHLALIHYLTDELAAKRRGITL